MNAPSNTAFSSPASVVRWSARALSALILLFWGYFIVAHLVGEEGAATRPLNAGDYIGLTAMAAWLFGLALAWKWELTGGSITLVALLVGSVVNWRMLAFPGTLIGIAAVLFCPAGG